MALVVLSVVEQRLDAVRAVLAGAEVTEVAAAVGVSPVDGACWLARYLAEGVAGLADRSHRPRSCPHQAPTAVEVAVAEMRRKHPRWGAKRIRMELLRRPAGRGWWCRRSATINRILIRQGLVRAAAAEAAAGVVSCGSNGRGRCSCGASTSSAGCWLVDPATGVVREAKVVTGVDDHSRFCVMAAVVERATGRAVCLAFAQALARFGVPEEVITDNGKQFTDRFGKGGEVLFDKICRHNGDHPPADRSRRRRTRTGRSSGSTAPSAASCSTTPARSSRWRRRRPRSTRGSSTTTPTGRTRRWMRGGR